MDRPRVLIEEWLPVAELGIESRREAAPIPGQFPKLKTLHVWWARRPLAATAGVILASVMPVWSQELADEFAQDSELSSDKSYQDWFLRLCGILGDPISAKRAQMAAIEAGVRIPNPYSYKPAFKNSPSTRDLSLLHAVLVQTWGSIPKVLDPTAGGGSIPYEAMRYGLPTHGNDLNDVAAAVLTAGVAIPGRWGSDLTPHLRKWGGELVSRVTETLSPYFPAGAGEEIATYLFVRTVNCPRTGKSTPLAPNWWLVREAGKEVAVRPITERSGAVLAGVEFEILRGDEARASAPDSGTLAGGNGISLWDHLAIDGDYIKAEARAGRMGSQLYAVWVGINGKRSFRPPSELDFKGLHDAQGALTDRLETWAKEDVLPTEEVPAGNKTKEPLQMGMTRWADFFSPRQLLVHGTFVEEFRKLVPKVRGDVTNPDKAEAILGVIAMMLSKGINFNAILGSWHATRGTMRSVFDSHNLAFKSSYAEFEGARELYPWCLEQVVDAYEGIVNLLSPSDVETLESAVLQHPVPAGAEVSHWNAGSLEGIESESFELICIDPPYGANVMYAELADYFFVWEKRTLGTVWPHLFTDDLGDKQNEAVANEARFVDAGKRRKELAKSDYEAKMRSIFSECHRALRSGGVMTVMFTHKDAGSWDALGAALMEAGFTIEASWPVNTESEQSIHQAKKNAAASTIMLVCRKRPTDAETGVFFEDLEPEVRSAARNALTSFAAKGIAGVDLLLSTYGPALSVISSCWPVFSSEPDPLTGKSRVLRPEEALDAARREVTRVQRQRLVGRDQALDPLSDFVLVAWDTFGTVEFPFDEARRLALAVGGLDIEELRRARILEKKSGTVTMLPPSKRVRREGDYEAGLSGVYPDATQFPVSLDAVHTAVYVADVDGLNAAKAFLDRAGLTSDGRFLAALQGLVNAMPMTKIKGKWVLPEAETLDRLCAAYFPDIAVPQHHESESFTQQTLVDGTGR